MGKSLYDVLGVAGNAAPELVDHACRLLQQRLEPAAAAGEEAARNELVAVREAYRILGSPERRAIYDQELALQARRAAVSGSNAGRSYGQPAVDHSGDGFLDWWDRSKTSWMLVGLFALGVALAGRTYYVSKQERAVRQAEIAARAEVEKARIDNERQAIEARRAEFEERQRRQQADQEQRERRAQLEADHRDAWQRAQFQLQRDRADEQAARSAQMATDRARSVEQARLDREHRYWSCMNQISRSGDLSRVRSYCGAQP
jgi:curved DNA-binding protein CbpA